MKQTTPPLPGLSPVNGKTVTARFDGGSLSSDAGLVSLREVERRLDVAGRLAACVDDPRDPTRTIHSVADILRFRMLMIAAGHEDGIDANALRADPVFKMALERLPGGRDLCSQSTVSRLESLPDRRMLLRMARAMVGLYCASFAQVPKRITLDIDDTFDAVHGCVSAHGWRNCTQHAELWLNQTLAQVLGRDFRPTTRGDGPKRTEFLCHRSPSPCDRVCRCAL